jgi:hypothetical protein
VPYCEFCGKETGILPFDCNYCGGSFCAEHRLPENHECSMNVEYRERLHRKKRQLIEKRRKEQHIGIRGERSVIGTYILYTIIVIPSIIAFFFPHYLCISIFTISSIPFPFSWTLFTAFFVVYFSNIVEFIYFIALLILSYYFIRTIEMRYGPRRLLFIFLASSFLGAIIYLVIVSLYPAFFFFSVQPIGLASAGLFGVCVFPLLGSSYKMWHLHNFSIKASKIIWFLAIFNIVSKVFTTILIYGIIDPYFGVYVYGYNILYFVFDLFGLLGAFVLYEFYYKRKGLI